MARAHLRYVQRDGTSRDGERGQLYSAHEDRADGDAFIDRCKDDCHQFRFIVSPEDGAELLDLTADTPDFMTQVEADLGTKLDWAADMPVRIAVANAEKVDAILALASPAIPELSPKLTNGLTEHHWRACSRLFRCGRSSRGWYRVRLAGWR